MTRYDIAAKTACWRKPKYSVCIKLGIAGVVCAVLCCTCYFVEKGRSGHARRNLDRFRSSEKLVQVEKTVHKAGSLLSAPRTDASHLPTDLNVEGSGDYFVAADALAASTQHNDTVDEPELTLHHAPTVELIVESDPPTNAQFKNSIEKIFERVPLLHEDNNDLDNDDDIETVDHRTSNEIIESTTFKSQVAYDYADFSIDETLAQAADDRQVENTKRNIFLNLQQASAEHQRTSGERFFSNEYSFNAASSAFDDLTDEYILTNYDNGDFINVKEVDYDDVDEDDAEVVPDSANVPTFLDSIFGHMSHLWTPKAQPPQKPKPQPQKHNVPKPYAALNHLANFKDSPHSTDHLELESNVKPVVKKTNGPIIPSNGVHHSMLLFPNLKPQPTFLSRFFNTPEDPVKDSIVMLKNFLNKIDEQK